MTPLSRSPYSYHFNNLLYLGMWVVETKNVTLINIYSFYRVFLAGFQIYGTLGLVMNLISVYGDLKKMSWNLCVTSLLVGISMRTFHLFSNSHRMNRIRKRLHRDAEQREKSGDTFINNLALKEMRVMRTLFYTTMILFIPTWIISRYFVHEALPIPFTMIPPPFDMKDKAQFIFMFVIISFASIFCITVAAETQLAMFGILIQISREYRVLLNDIPKLNEPYETPDAVRTKGKEMRQEVNPLLKNKKTKALVKKLSCKLQQIFEYINEFEYCYRAANFEEVLGTSTIIVALGVQSLLGKVDLSGDFFYQIGYLCIVIIDMFALCMYATRLQTQCFQVGIATYSTMWYRMATDIQRDIMLIIMRAQNPPKITAAKLMELNLTVFMHRMSNIYSWLALLRQLEFKVQQDSQPI